MIRLNTISLLTMVSISGALIPLTAAAYEASACDSAQQHYAFSWPIDGDCKSKPRGGSSRGAAVTMAEEPSQQWVRLQEDGLSKFERDRRAILAMQGGYKVNFDFLETIGFSNDYQRDRPYQSWGTEYVYVVEDQPEFISLQHVMVMVFKQEDGSLSEPMVMKHWRQDWTYQDASMLEYSHERVWFRNNVDKSQREGKWTQAVFQVDDSPRYESIGEWQHNASFSSWKSAQTRRPLPRREHSIRSDYNVLEGVNTHVITQHGWVQVEENWKMVTTETGQRSKQTPYLSKEQGIARYQPITDFDFKPGDDYMALAGLFWADVRQIWNQILAEKGKHTVLKKVNDQMLFMSLFAYASDVMKAGKYNAKAGREFAEQEIEKYVN